MAIDAKVLDTHFHLDGVDYFRGQADAVQLGDAGERRTPAAPQSYLEVRASVPRPKLKIARAVRIDIHRLALAGSDFPPDIAIPGVGSLGGATVARQLEDQTLSLVRIETLPQDIVSAANESPAVIAELVRAGHSGRLVHQAFVILAMKMALNYTRATQFELSGTAKSWTITASGGGAGASRTVVTLGPGSTFAYLLLKPRWDARQPQDWQRIEGWEDDPWSLH